MTRSNSAEDAWIRVHIVCHQLLPRETRQQSIPGGWRGRTSPPVVRIEDLIAKGAPPRVAFRKVVREFEQRRREEGAR